ncbi:MAG: hypothetical protein HQL43_03855 [Alphaproteobacteria bacterium]|nr:hypothetical protein [Alphaproteobacteria bacterium]
MIDKFVSKSDIPKTRKAGNGIREEPFIDAEVRASFSFASDAVKKAWDHPVIYRWNSHGYRCAEFSQPGKLSVLTIGCSWAMGSGLNEEDTFAHMLCKRLHDFFSVPVSNWNLGFGGKSNDYIARTLCAAVPILRPDFVFVNFTHFGRREYFTSDGRCFDFQHNQLDLEKQGIIKWTMVNREIVKNMVGLTSQFDDNMNFYKNYQLIELLLQNYNIPWFYSATSPSMIIPLIDFLDADRFLGFGLELIDTAHDESHPGPESNHFFADRLFARVLKSFGAELSAKLNPA